MPRLRNLVVMSCLLAALAGCQSDDGDDLSANARSAPPANSAAPAPTNTTATKLTEQESAFMVAAAKGDTKTVKELLDKGVNVDTRDPADNNATALIHAAWFGHADTVQLLIDRGADVNAKKSNGASVLKHASDRGHTEVVEILKKAGAK